MPDGPFPQLREEIADVLRHTEGVTDRFVILVTDTSPGLVGPPTMAYGPYARHRVLAGAYKIRSDVDAAEWGTMTLTVVPCSRW
jgi:hypothetical protein